MAELCSISRNNIYIEMYLFVKPQLHYRMRMNTTIRKLNVKCCNSNLRWHLHISLSHPRVYAFICMKPRIKRSRRCLQFHSWWKIMNLVVSVWELSEFYSSISLANWFEILFISIIIRPDTTFYSRKVYEIATSSIRLVKQSK